MVLGEDRRAAVRQIVAIDRGDDRVLSAMRAIASRTRAGSAVSSSFGRPCATAQ
jgi:hypothetical protein